MTEKMSPNASPSGCHRPNVFDTLSDLRDPLDQLIYDHSLLSRVPPETAAFTQSLIDWKETPEAHVFKADLPGVNRVQVKLWLEGGATVLQIYWERGMEKQDKNGKWHRVEGSGGKSLWRFRLPENAQGDQVKCSMDDGVLTVIVQKEEVEKPEVKSMEISG